MIRLIQKNDLDGLLNLYTQLHNNSLPVKDNKLEKLWKTILDDEKYFIIVSENENKIISSCTLIIIPNLTHHQQPYALIENVITDKEYRHQGCAASVLNYAKNIAVKNNCYKIMLMTGSKDEKVLSFYKQAGYNSSDKTGFIRWL